MMPTFNPDGMPSMRQDVLAKRPTEVEEFAGVVRQRAKKYGMPTLPTTFSTPASARSRRDMTSKEPPMHTLYFTRHGETVWNVENKICGMTDSPLTERGRQQARKLGEAVKASGVHIDEILYSPCPAPPTPPWPLPRPPACPPV